MTSLSLNKKAQVKLGMGGEYLELNIFGLTKEEMKKLSSLSKGHLKLDKGNKDTSIKWLAGLARVVFFKD